MPLKLCAGGIGGLCWLLGLKASGIMMMEGNWLPVFSVLYFCIFIPVFLSSLLCLSVFFGRGWGSCSAYFFGVSTNGWSTAVKKKVGWQISIKFV